ncbi:MAG TPA: cytochrome c3 family protein [Bacteroidales bacterium]|nr:cytochrome c3 family protein [Bacteroidales bacterium]
MNKKRKKQLKDNFWAIILMLVLAGVIIFYSYNYEAFKKTNNLPARAFTSKTDNERCLKCHAHNICELPDSKDSSKTITHYMAGSSVIDTVRFYSSNHWNFKCTDCHSDEYLTQPHDPALKSAPMSTCIDCHGGDDAYAKYHFENIESDFFNSTHYKKDSVNFTCWNCHNAHYDRLSMRDTLREPHQVISYDNNMCLKCHSKQPAYQGNYLSDSIKTDMMALHQWLPETEKHLTNLRCIDCHTSQNDSLLVPHDILDKSMALKDCKACHAENSMLLKTLYKNRISSGMKKVRFLKNVPVDGQIVPKPKKHPVLNIVLASLSALLLVIVLFIVFRYLIPFAEKKHDLINKCKKE